MRNPGMAGGEFDQRLADRLLQGRAIPALAHLLGVAIAFLLVQDTLPIAYFLAWAGAVIVVIGVRAALWTWASRQMWSARAVALAARVTLLALGLAWGLGSALAASYVPPAEMATLLLVLVSLGTAGATVLVADRWVLPLYAVSLFGTTIVGLMRVADSRAEWLAIAVVVFLVGFTVRLHQQAYHALVAHLRSIDVLRTQETQFAAAQALAHVGSWELDLATNHVTWSAEAYRLYGVPMGSPVSYELFLTCVHPDDRARVEQVVNRSLAELTDVEFEYRALRPDGSVRAVLGRNMVIKDAAGSATGFAGTSLDITERKATEDALRAALREVKTLRGYLRVCANCKRVVGEDGTWEQLESYVRRHSEAEFSHGICPDCAKTWAGSGV